MIIELIVYSFLTLLFVCLIFNNVKIKYKNFELQQKLLESMLNRNMLLENMKALSKSKSIVEDDGFNKFINQSRDWAFQYIEFAQLELNKIINQQNSLTKEEIIDRINTLLPTDNKND